MTLAASAQRAFRLIHAQAKEAITYKQVTSVTFDADNTKTVTTSSASVNAVVQVMNMEDRQVQAGLLEVGDITVFFLPVQTVAIRDRLTWNSEDYEIVAVIPEKIAGTLIFTEAHAKRMHAA